MQRTAPSQLIVAVIATVSVFFRFGLAYLGYVSEAIFKRNILGHPSRIEFGDSTPSETFKVKDSIPFVLPDIIVAYKSRPPPADQAKLDEWGVEAEKISTVRNEVFIVRNPTLEMATSILEFSGILESYRPTNTAITVHGILPLFGLISQVSRAAMALEALRLERVEMGIFGPGITTPAALASGDIEMEEGEMEIGQDTLLHEEPIDYFVTAKENTIHKPWGPVENLVELTPEGIFCPFEMNFAAPDPLAIRVFIQTFISLFASNVDHEEELVDLELVQQMWATEICNTLTGHHLAHIMSCLVIAATAGAYIYVLQIPDKHYEGCVIVKGQSSLTLRGAGLKPVSSVDSATLNRELSEFGFHTVILRKILDLVGAMTVTTESITSMRHLREIVFAGTGIPAGNVRNAVARLLPKLSFGQRPLGLNENAVNQVLHLLANPDQVIPRDLFLPTGSFFVEDVNRTQLVIAAWGDRPPSFNFGGTPLMATAMKGRRVSSGLADYTTTPPAVLQMKRIPMVDAVAGWNTMMQKGFINGIYNRKAPQARSFNGPEKTRVWQALQRYLAETVSDSVTASLVQTAPGPSGVKRAGDESTIGDAATRKKKKLI